MRFNVRASNYTGLEVDSHGSMTFFISSPSHVTSDLIYCSAFFNLITDPEDLAKLLHFVLCLDGCVSRRKKVFDIFAQHLAPKFRSCGSTHRPLLLLFKIKKNNLFALVLKLMVRSRKLPPGQTFEASFSSGQEQSTSPFHVHLFFFPVVTRLPLRL